MGPAPIPIPGLSVLLGVYAMLFRAPFSISTTDSTETRPTVDAVIPALNEANNIAYAIASLNRQTVRPDTLTVVDDGSDDATASVVEAMSEVVELDVELVSYDTPGGKTRRIKEVVRASTAEKLFVLDADTYLEDATYLDSVLAAHDRNEVGCSFGTVRPDSRALRRHFYDRELDALVPATGAVNASVRPTEESERTLRSRAEYRLTKWPVERYRDVLYAIEQSFSKASQMRLFGTSLFPVGCGVLYDRESLRAVFDDFEDPLGDQLTNSEDIFIGFVFIDRGLANVQVDDVTMRTTEPTINRLRRQVYLWGSAYLQSAYYFRAYSDGLRSLTGDITDEIVGAAEDDRGGSGRHESETDDEPNSDESRDDDSCVTDGGVSSVERDRTVAESLSPETGIESDSPRPESRSLESDSGIDGDSTWNVPISVAVGAQIVDGLYPITLLAVGFLVSLGVVGLEILVAVVLLEFSVYFLLIGAFAARRLSVPTLLVSIPVRLLLLPFGAYLYIRVGSDLVRGNRDWMK